MVNHDSLRELDNAQQNESRIARQRIELAEEYVAHYRRRIELVQESFYELSAREGVADDPGFRAELRRVSDHADQNVRAAGRMIADLHDDYQAMTAQHSLERARVIDQQRESSEGSTG